VLLRNEEKPYIVFLESRTSLNICIRTSTDSLSSSGEAVIGAAIDGESRLMAAELLMICSIASLARLLEQQKAVGVLCQESNGGGCAKFHRLHLNLRGKGHVPCDVRLLYVDSFGRCCTLACDAPSPDSVFSRRLAMWVPVSSLEVNVQ